MKTCITAIIFVFAVAPWVGHTDVAYAADDSAEKSNGAKAEQEKRGRMTGLPIPRFVSLKAKKVNLRVGPGRKYKISWQYQRQNLPVEVIQEFDQWRRIRDSDGGTGWVLHSLLSSKRTAIVAPWDRPKEDIKPKDKQKDKPKDLAKTQDEAGSVEEAEKTEDLIGVLASKPVFFEGKEQPSETAATVAHLQAGLMVNLTACSQQWCSAQVKEAHFWVQKKALWGIYPNEIIDE